MKKNKSIIVLFALITYILNLTAQTSPKEVCLNTYNFNCEICTNNPIFTADSTLIINPLHLISDGLGFVTVLFDFKPDTEKSNLVPMDIKIVRIKYRECFDSFYVLDYSLLCKEEETLFRIVAEQTLTMFQDKVFFQRNLSVDSEYDCSSCLTGEYTFVVQFKNKE